MKVGRKLQKLIDPDGLLSAVEHARRWSHSVDWKPMFRSLDQEKWAALEKRYLDSEFAGSVGNSAKFADARYWLKVNIERAQDLNLDRTPPLRILDLGCGAGYFLYVCRRLGHETLGLDIDENPLFRDTLELLKARRVVWRIEPFERFPDLDEKFDLVTAHCICFQKLRSSQEGNRQEWGADEWRFFLADVRSRLLTETGSLLLDFNPRGNGVYYPPAVEMLFREEGARIFRSKVVLSGGSRRPDA